VKGLLFTYQLKGAVSVIRIRGAIVEVGQAVCTQVSETQDEPPDFERIISDSHEEEGGDKDDER
jgi:hypothetical protein